MPKALKLTGQVFGRLKVLSQNHDGPKGMSWWDCECECGNTKVLRGSALVSGNTKSCGCLEYENRVANTTRNKANPEDYIGKKFGRITVTEIFTERRKVRGRGICECGNDWEGVLRILYGGTVKSCGCLTVECTRERFTTHGMTAGGLSREYKAWQAMNRRCYDEKFRDYPYYGARGIVVCDAWKNDPAQFEKDMGACPDGYTLDRIDNDGPYSPENCRWASRLTQARNSRKNTLLTHNGETKPMSQWAEETGISYYVLRSRVTNLGWDDEKALTTPVRPTTNWRQAIRDAEHGK